MKCLDCASSLFMAGVEVGMPPCFRCNGTGYIVESLIGECNHKWVSAENEVVKGCAICVKCLDIKATPSH